MGKGRAQCIVARGNRILMVQHREGGQEWFCLPGGGMEPGETQEQAALRELQEECCVTGTIIKKTSEWADPFDDHRHPTFWVDIGAQEPVLGCDPEVTGDPILVGVAWRRLDELCERDRAYLWAAGLISVPPFYEELAAWGNDISYPEK